MVAGRRWGKTRLGVLEGMARALQGKRVWWVAPNYKLARAGWRLFLELALQLPPWLVEVSRAEQRVSVMGGGEIWVRSADEPHSLRGEGLDFVVMDEYAFMREEVWTQVVRPALAERQGGALFISTPHGHNHFHRLVQQAQPPEWEVFRFTSADNPFLPAKEIERMRRELPELVFRQEVGAEFVNLHGALVRPELVQYGTASRAGEVFVGVDLAASRSQTADYTAIVAGTLEEDGTFVVFLAERGHWTFPQTRDRLLELSRELAPRAIAIESVQYQLALSQELLASSTLPIVPVRPVKDKVTRFLPVLSRIEHGRLRFERDLPAWLFDELLSFPEGEHDDAVDALVYAFSCTQGLVSVSQHIVRVV